MHGLEKFHGGGPADWFRLPRWSRNRAAAGCDRLPGLWEDSFQRASADSWLRPPIRISGPRVELCHSANGLTAASFHSCWHWSWHWFWHCFWAQSTPASAAGTASAAAPPWSKGEQSREPIPATLRMTKPAPAKFFLPSSLCLTFRQGWISVRGPICGRAGADPQQTLALQLC